MRPCLAPWKSGCCRSSETAGCVQTCAFRMTSSLSHHWLLRFGPNVRSVSGITESASLACDHQPTAMMSVANREIRTMERQADERRRRVTFRDLLHHIDRLVAELEEMNLAGEREVPDEFFLELNGLVDILPSQVAFPATPPHRPSAMIDYLFVLEEQILQGRPRVLH